MRIKQTNVYTYNELSDKAKEKAREWYREGAFEFDWWDFLYDDFEQRAKELGIELSRKVTMIEGK